MKPKPGLLSPLIRSDVQGLILAKLFMNADRDFTITDLAEYAFTSVPTAMREVDRLVEAAYVLDKPLGRTRLIRADQQHPLFEAIFQIVANSYGPATLLPRALNGLFGLQRAFIYGSWAQRLAQQPGPQPTELEVLLVGNMNRIDASRALVAVEEKIGLPLTLQFVNNVDFEHDSTEFVRTIKQQPLLELNLTR
jgi:hypothetical protein